MPRARGTPRADPIREPRPFHLRSDMLIMNDIHDSTLLGVQPGAAPIERPASLSLPTAMFGSDAIADALRALGVPYIALNPGASFRGLHDSLVNYLGNERPQMLLCLHEEHAVAIAHGYAKVTGRAMAAAAHSNVGLMHATMALFNAWCDRMPLVLVGATGPIDAAHRRPWIEWIHTARDQGALVRDYTKWDDQPASPAAAREAILRAGGSRRPRPRDRSTSISTWACRRRRCRRRCRPSIRGATCPPSPRRPRPSRSRASPHCCQAPSGRCCSSAASHATKRPGPHGSGLRRR